MVKWPRHWGSTGEARYCERGPEARFCGSPKPTCELCIISFPLPSCRSWLKNVKFQTSLWDKLNSRSVNSRNRTISVSIGTAYALLFCGAYDGHRLHGTKVVESGLKIESGPGPIPGWWVSSTFRDRGGRNWIMLVFKTTMYRQVSVTSA